MPTYKVKEPGFMYGRLYDPEGKRRFLVSDTVLKPKPSWLEGPIKETAAQARNRKKQVTAQQAKAKRDKELKESEMAAVTFDNGPSPTHPPSGGGNVKTL